MIEWTIVLKSAGLYLVLTLIHELGHAGGAALGGVSIQNVGQALLPVPHFYVQVEPFPTATHRYFFFLSGPLLVILVMVGWWAGGILFVPSVYLAGATRLLLDGNPFFSDFTKMIDGYRYTVTWYVHLAMWGGLMIVVTRYYQFIVASTGVR